MATNVTEKDKTLKEVIDWCEEQVARIDEKIPNASDEGFLTGDGSPCKLSLLIALGYSGSTPSDAPNQSEE